jgi:AcrR family transcriptional regulator
MSNKNLRVDPRVLRTRKLLRQSLIDLVPKKGFNNLTIQDITDNATLNRATFYLHYTDKDELLLDVFENMVSAFVPIPSSSVDLNINSPQEEILPIVAVFDHIAEFAEFYCAILGEQGGPIFMARVRQFIADITKKWLEVFMPSTFLEKELLDITINFLGSAYLGVITWWLENDMPYTPIEMEKHLLKLTNQGISVV